MMTSSSVLPESVSLPLPPITVSIRVPNAMPRLFDSPPTLFSDPSTSDTDEACEKPDRSSVLWAPPSQMASIGWVSTEKSKKPAVSPAMLEWKPNTWPPPDSGESFGRP